MDIRIRAFRFQITALCAVANSTAIFWNDPLCEGSEEMLNETIVVKYKTEKNYCSCCNQKLPNPQTSKEREFEFSKENALNWADWHSDAEYPEDMEGMVQEFVHETISFYATSSYEEIIIDDGEVEKVKEFILRVVVA
jgi:hypothetical protein